MCFGLNRATWNDERLWITIVNKQYTYTRRVLKKKEKGKEGEPDEYVIVEYEETLLHRACREGRESSVRRLLCLGACLRATDKRGDWALGRSGAGCGELARAEGLGELAAGCRRRHAPRSQQRWLDGAALGCARGISQVL